MDFTPLDMTVALNWAERLTEREREDGGRRTSEDWG